MNETTENPKAAAVGSNRLLGKRTKTQEAKAALDKDFEELRANYRKVVREEFKPGMKVKYQHGLKWIEGVVIEVAKWEWSTYVTFRNQKTGAIWEREAHEVEFA